MNLHQYQTENLTASLPADVQLNDNGYLDKAQAVFQNAESGNAGVPVHEGVQTERIK